MEDVLVESERLLLRRPEERDHGTLERAFCDPAMMRYLGDPWTVGRVLEVLGEWREDWGVESRWSGVLVRRDTGEAVGTAGCTLDTVSGEPGLELSWFVVPEHQRRGYATEITRELSRFAFENLGGDRVVVETHPDNRAANGVLGRLGFACLGERQHEYDDLPGFDTQVLWQLTRAMWQREAT